VSTAIGYGFGYFLDQLFGTTYLSIVFLLFGIAAGFVSFFRAISAAERIETEAGKTGNGGDGSSRPKNPQ